ncbi:MAG: ligase 1 [Pseudomonadota bacterium]|nr:ligase 1 [Pseudomonadota bacterium]
MADEHRTHRGIRRRQGLRSGLALLGGWFGVVWRVLAVPPSLADPEPRPGERFGVTLARMAEPDIDPAGHLVSEKYDGVRAIWDGRHLRTRQGHVIPAPASFVSRLPAGQPLDGELWLGRGHGQFEAVSALVRRRRPSEADWARVFYLVFEIPAGPGRFDERVERLGAIVEQVGWPQLVAVAQQRIDTREALRERLAAVLASGGEGLMLHRADAPFVAGRTGWLLKLKPVQEDEAVVIGHTPGEGRLLGRTGALQVRTAEGTVFLVGSGLTDALRAAPPPLGSRIVYSCQGQTRHGVPRFPTFVRVSELP